MRQKNQIELNSVTGAEGEAKAPPSERSKQARRGCSRGKQLVRSFSERIAASPAVFDHPVGIL
jgi:hypothetical protein